MPDLLEIVQRTRTKEDDSFLYTLFKEIRSPEFLPLQLPPQGLEDLLMMQFRAQRLSYEARYPDAEDSVVWSGKERIGRLLVDRSPEGLHLIDIALLANFRCRGAGSMLLRTLLTEAGTKNLSLRLHVRPSNPAAGLYRRLGFVVCGGDGMNVLMEALPRTRAAQLEQAEEPLAEVPSRSGPLQPETSSRYFRQLTGETLQAFGRGKESVDLTLEAVEWLADGDAAGQSISTDSFVLRFSGPLQPELPSSIVEVSHRDAAPLAIFLVPVARSNGRVEYESIFNRAVPL